jgi:hypothetical protein
MARLESKHRSSPEASNALCVPTPSGLEQGQRALERAALVQCLHSGSLTDQQVEPLISPDIVRTSSIRMSGLESASLLLPRARATIGESDLKNGIESSAKLQRAKGRGD